MSIQDLTHENELLKNLSSALERENISKTQEIKILTQELEKLGRENQKYMNSSRISNQSNSSSNTQINKLSMKLKELTAQFDRLRSEKNQIQKDLAHKNSDIKRYEGQIKDYRQIEKQLNLRIQVLIQENQQMDKKIQSENQKNESEKKGQEDKLLQEIQQLRQQIHWKEGQIRNLTIKCQQSDKNSHKNQNIEIRNLKYQMIQSENKIILLQKERDQKQRKIRDLEVQIIELNKSLAKNTQNSHEMQMLRQNIKLKDHQLSSANSMINKLKENVNYCENKIANLEITIQEIQQRQEQQNEQRVRDSRIHQEEIKSIILEYQNRMKQFEVRVRNNYELEKSRERQNNFERNGQILQENQELNRVIRQLQQDNERLEQILSQAHHSRIQQPEHQERKRRRKSTQLQDIVENLRNELYDVKEDFRRMNLENSRMHDLVNQQIYSNPKKDLSREYHRKDMNLGEQLRDRKMTFQPTVGNEKDFYKNRRIVPEPIERNNRKNSPQIVLKPNSNQSVGKNTSINNSSHSQKWSALQKRINQLREENEELKKQLNN